MAADNPTDENARTRVVDSDAPQALGAGTQLGRYRIEGMLGQGGFGITYRAIDTSLDRPVAIKEYLPLEVAIRIDGSTVVPRTRKDGADYEWGLQRFLEEAKMLARHEAVPNMVRVYDFIEANGTAYMVMALVTGDNLAIVLRRRGTLPEAELKAIALPLLDGLGRLHEAGLVHRDIKPANIILSATGAPTLIDFGAARQALGRLSRSITSIVTPGYAPFEQYGSAGEQGPWTDIYALAATLYHGVTGKPPPDSVDRIRRDPMVPALQAGGGRYTEGFLLAIDTGLKVDETERPQIAEQWRALLTEGSQVIAPVVAQPTPSAAQPVSRPPSRPLSQPVSATSSQPVSQVPPPSILAASPAARAGSRKTMIAVGVAAAVIAGGAAVALTMGSSNTPSSPSVAKPTTPDPAIQAAAAEKQRTADLEKRLAEEAESRKKLEAQIAEAEVKRKAEEEARRKAAEEVRLKAEAETREKAETENRRRIEEDTRKKVEAEFKAKAEEAKLAADEAKKKADEAKRTPPPCCGAGRPARAPKRPASRRRPRRRAARRSRRLRRAELERDATTSRDRAARPRRCTRWYLRHRPALQ